MVIVWNWMPHEWHEVRGTAPLTDSRAQVDSPLSGYGQEEDRRRGSERLEYTCQPVDRKRCLRLLDRSTISARPRIQCHSADTQPDDGVTPVSRRSPCQKSHRIGFSDSISLASEGADSRSARVVSAR